MHVQDLLHHLGVLLQGLLFYGRKADGSKLDEQYVDMIYREADKRCYFNDVADDILAQVPSFSGSVGYICEYDE